MNTKNKATATATLATATVTPSAPAFKVESTEEQALRLKREAAKEEQAKHESEAEKKAARLFKFRKLEIDPADLMKIAADGSSAVGLVRAAYERAGMPFTETLLESESDGVTTLNKAIATAKKLVKDYGLSASAANNWLAYKQIELAFKFARSIGKL